MTPTERREAIIERIRLELARAKADRPLKALANGVAVSTVCRILRRGDCRVSTLIDLADGLGCDVQVTITKRPAA